MKPGSATVLILLCALLAAIFTYTQREQSDASATIRVWHKFETFLGSFLILGLMSSVVIQVVTRYGHIQSLDVPWSEEVARLFLVWSAFWGAALVQRSDGHLAVDALFNLLPSRAKFLVRLLGYAVTLVFLMIVVWHGWWLARLQHGIDLITVDWPAALFDYSVPICGAIMIVQTCYLALRCIFGRPVQPNLGQEI